VDLTNDINYEFAVVTVDGDGNGFAGGDFVLEFSVYEQIN
jgi:hypothetical protein